MGFEAKHNPRFQCLEKIVFAGSRLHSVLGSWVSPVFQGDKKAQLATKLVAKFDANDAGTTEPHGSSQLSCLGSRFLFGAASQDPRREGRFMSELMSPILQQLSIDIQDMSLSKDLCIQVVGISHEGNGKI